jgi:glycosyltransferase involved in cell wall biosynthesis
MRILHVIDHLGLGGAQTALAALVQAWPCDEDTIETIGLGRQCELASAIGESTSGEVSMLDYRRWDVRAMGRLQKRIRQGGRYDIVHAHLCKSCCATLWLKPSIRTSLVLHLHCDPRSDFRVFRWALRRWLPRADAVVAVSRHTAQAARHFGVPAAKLHTIYNPTAVDMAGSDAGVSAGRCLRRDLNIPPDAFLLGFVGRLSREKGVSYLIQAVQRLKQRGCNVFSVVVGDGPLASELRAETRQRDVEDRVRFAGYQSAVASWVRASDALVLPSLSEGLPMVLAEAMALGTPAIATRVGGIPEIIRHGETGWLIPARSPDALCDTICQMMDAPQLRRGVAENARRLAEDTFSGDRIGARVREVYRGALEGV